MNTESPLTGTSLYERHLEAQALVREDPTSGPVLLSYVIWPGDFPTFKEIDKVVRFKQRQAKVKRTPRLREEDAMADKIEVEVEVNEAPEPEPEDEPKPDSEEDGA